MPYRIDATQVIDFLDDKIKNMIPKIQFALDTYAKQLRRQLTIHSPRGITGALRRSYKIIDARLEGSKIIVTVYSETDYAEYQDTEILRHVPRKVLGQESFQDPKYRKGEGYSRWGTKSKRKLKMTPSAKYWRGLYHSQGIKAYKAEIVIRAKLEAGESELFENVRKAITS